MFCAHWVKHGYGKIYYYIAAFIGLPLFLFLYVHYPIVYNYRFLSFLFLMPTIVISITLFVRYADIKFINRTLSEMGKASLEIYLVQGFFYHLVIYSIVDSPSNYHDLLTVGYIIISTTIGCYIHHLWEKSYFHLNK